jgi:hypothetical protein
MKAAIRVCLLALLALGTLPSVVSGRDAASTETVPPGLRSQVLERFRVIVVRDGIVLTPRSGDQRTIEIGDDGVTIDGAVVSGREIREKLGSDASSVLQLSYVSAAELKRAFENAVEPDPEPPAPVDADAPEAAEPGTPDEDRSPAREDRHGEHDGRQRSGSKVRFGGNITVDEDERVRDAVVAIGGSVSVHGQVDGDVVAIGGGIHLGPKAVVNGAVTSIGGGINREDGSRVNGDVVELGIGGPWTIVPWSAVGFQRDLFSEWFRLVGTGLRIALLLLVTLLVVAVADRPVSRIAARAGDDPWVSGFVGLAAEILFVPVLVITVVVLAISIIGIPLLLLVPFAIVALLLGVLMGFAGVARRLGRWAVGDGRSAISTTAVGVILIVAGAILARLLYLIPGPFWPIAMAVGATGLFLEYVAWTVGLGALLLTRFGTRPQAPAVWTQPPPVPPPVPTPVTDAP